MTRRMTRYRAILTICCLALGSLLLSSPARAGLAEALKDGQHVLLMRHADAPGVGDPAGYDLSQCATQRNLGELGKKQAREIGRWLAAQGIKNPHVLSSVWCRCMDTATLLNLGPVKVAPALGSFFDDMSQAEKQTKALTALIQTELKKHPSTPLILVTHHVNIQAFTGKNVSQGDMVLVKVNAQGGYLSHIVYPSPTP